MEGAESTLIGMVTESSELIIEDGYDEIIQADVDELTNFMERGVGFDRGD